MTEQFSVVELLRNLVDIPSFSGSEVNLSNYLYDFLTQKGFTVTKQKVENDRYNLIIKVGEPKVYFLAHMDTVPPFIQPGEDEKYIFGRGACDTKASIATMIGAAIESKSAGLSDFGLIFTVGEEVDFKGAKEIVHSKLAVPFAVIGEPTGLRIINGHYGVLVITLTAKGKKAHSSNRESGENAITKMLDAINMVRTKLKIQDRSFMDIVKIHGGVADNIIPDEAEAKLSFRIAPGDENDYFSQIKQLVGEQVQVTKEIFLSSVLAEVPSSLQFIPAAGVVKYCTELSVLKKGIVLGPGDINYAHTDIERIEKKELLAAVELYKKIIEKFNAV